MAVPATTAGITALPESAVVIPSCATEDRPGYARCLSRFRSPGTGFTGSRVAVPRGFGPAQFRAAYGLPATGARTTIGVVVRL